MAFTDLTAANGWIPVQHLSDVLQNEDVESAVESSARKETMTSAITKVPRFSATGIDVVAEGAEIPLKSATVDAVQLEAFKFADRFAVSSEDSEDAIADAFAAYTKEWLNNYKIALDHATLGTVGAQNGTTRPFTSVYQAVGSGNRTATAGALTYEDLVEAVGELEATRKGELVIFAHPSIRMTLRSLKDLAGNFVVDADGRLGSAVPTIFGHEVKFTFGAATGTALSDSPAGNPLIVVAAKKELILGVRSGPEAKVSSEAQWANDNLEIKLRARRGFALAEANSARVIEITGA